MTFFNMTAERVLLAGHTPTNWLVVRSNDLLDPVSQQVDISQVNRETLALNPRPNQANIDDVVEATPHSEWKLYLHLQTLYLYPQVLCLRKTPLLNRCSSCSRRLYACET